MGEIADDLIDGTFDYVSGEYLGEGPGYPRTMHREKGKNYGSNPKVGATKYLLGRDIPLKDQYKLIKEFVEDIKGSPVVQNTSKKELCITIGEHFDEFRKFTTKYLSTGYNTKV
jgi:hypothetical protein